MVDSVDNNFETDLNDELDSEDQVAQETEPNIVPLQVNEQPKNPPNAAELVVDGLVKQGKASPEMAAKIKDHMAAQVASKVITEQEKHDVAAEQMSQAQPPITKPSTPSAPANKAEPTNFIKPQAVSLAEQSQMASQGMEAERQKLEGGVQKQIAGLAAQGQIGAAQAKAEAETYGEKLKALEDHQKRAANLQAQSDAVFKSKIDAVQKIQDSLLKSKVDPNHYWKTLPTGNKVGVAIGLILGGLGAGAGGNKAVEVIENAIKRDIDVQKENISNSQAGLKNQMNLLELYRQKFQDDRQAESQYMITTMEMVKGKLEQVASKYKAPAIQAQALQAIGQLEEKQANELMKMRAIELKNQAKIARPSRFGEYGNVNINELGSKEERESHTSFGVASNKAAANRLREQGAELSSGIQGAESLLKLAEQSNRASLKDRAAIRSRMVALTGQLRIPFTGPGVLQEKEYQRLMESIGNPNKLLALKGVELESLKTVAKILKEKLDNEIAIAGIKKPKVDSFQPASNDKK